MLSWFWLWDTSVYTGNTNIYILKQYVPVYILVVPIYIYIYWYSLYFGTNIYIYIYISLDVIDIVYIITKLILLLVYDNKM